MHFNLWHRCQKPTSKQRSTSCFIIMASKQKWEQVLEWVKCSPMHWKPVLSRQLTEGDASLQCIIDHQHFIKWSASTKKCYTPHWWKWNQCWWSIASSAGEQVWNKAGFYSFVAYTYLYCRSYRVAAYQQLIYWTYQRLGRGIRKVIPQKITLSGMLIRDVGRDASKTAVICLLSSIPIISTLFAPCFSIVHDGVGT